MVKISQMVATRDHSDEIKLAIKLFIILLSLDIHLLQWKALSYHFFPKIITSLPNFFPRFASVYVNIWGDSISYIFKKNHGWRELSSNNWDDLRPKGSSLWEQDWWSLSKDFISRIALADKYFETLITGCLIETDHLIGFQLYLRNTLSIAEYFFLVKCHSQAFLVYHDNNSNDLNRRDCIFVHPPFSSMVNAMDSWLSKQGWSPTWGHCLVFLGKTLFFCSASLHQHFINEYWKINAGWVGGWGVRIDKVSFI